MAIVDTIYKQQFVDGMRDSFSYEACEELFDYYEALSDDLGENIEYDPIAFRGDWNEYEDIKGVIHDFSPTLERCDVNMEDSDEENLIEEVMLALQNYSVVIRLTHGFLVQVF